MQVHYPWGRGRGRHADEWLAAAMKRVVMSYRTKDCGQVKPSRSTFLTEHRWQEP